MKKKLYLVSREVWANNVKQAIVNKGSVYKVETADDRYQPEEATNKKIGFDATQNNKSK